MFFVYGLVLFILYFVSVVGKRYRPGGSSRGGGYGGGGYSSGGRYDSKPRSGAYGAQSDNINAMFAQAYQQVAASASGGAPGGGGGGSYTGYNYQ